MEADPAEVVGLNDKKEKCGLFAAQSASGTDVVPRTIKGLEALQHRGQESWGLAAFGKPTFRRMGLVANWHLEEEQLLSYNSPSAIGHVRYSTKGRSVLDNAQPIDIEAEFALAHNGTIANADELSASVSDEFGRTCDCCTSSGRSGTWSPHSMRFPQSWSAPTAS
jgi:glutamine phosphoribosylpyrophosphate amidotransferase